MKSLRNLFLRLVSEESGATATEYALLVTLVAIAIIVGATALGTGINNRLNSAANTIKP